MFKGLIRFLFLEVSQKLPLNSQGDPRHDLQSLPYLFCTLDLHL